MVAVLTVILLVVSSSVAQEALPLLVNVTSIQGNGEECPATDQVIAAADAIEANILHTIEENYELILNPDIDPNAPFCVGTGWRRAAFLNMSDASSSCPAGLSVKTYSGVRVCGLADSIGQFSCAGATFPVADGSYTEVCGRLVGYQLGDTPGFGWFRFGGNSGSVETINFDGVMVSHGSPSSRQHIWSFVTGKNEGNFDDSCPCAASDDWAYTVPPYIGNEYYCETGKAPGQGGGFYSQDPLWDGNGCHNTDNTCCLFHDPPYFYRQLPAATSDDIEIRTCAFHGPPTGGTYLQLIDLYVK